MQEDPSMRAFAEIISMAAERKGGMRAVEALLAETPVLPHDTIAATPDDRVLAAMTRRIFSAGFSSKVIDDKWPAFEAAFHQFDPRACAFISEAEFDALTKNPGIVRNGAKIKSVHLNSRFLLDLAAEHTTAARFFADWPDSDYVGLLDVLKKRGSHLGGDSGMRFLRSIGKAAFIPRPDVITALVREGVLERAPSGKSDFQTMQVAFNAWSAESGRNLTEISRVLAMTVDSGEQHQTRQ
jgi:3-methyladenine DNA glycosylase Tag